MQIKADVKTIEHLKDYFFVVPDYQREYVWEPDKHVSQFLDDIHNEFGNETDIKNQKRYFIGSIIIVKREDGTFEVIDGQQRLTTIVIFLCAFRDYIEKMDIPQELKEQKEEFLKEIKDLLYKYY